MSFIYSEVVSLFPCLSFYVQLASILKGWFIELLRSSGDEIILCLIWLAVAWVIGYKQIKLSNDQLEFTKHQAKLDSIRFQIDNLQLSYDRVYSINKEAIKNNKPVQDPTLFEDTISTISRLMKEYDSLSNIKQ